jgi:hypothetical protein
MKKRIEGFVINITWRYADGTWNTETIPEDNLPNSFLNYLKEYERCENENN